MKGIGIGHDTVEPMANVAIPEDGLIEVIEVGIWQAKYRAGFKSEAENPRTRDSLMQIPTGFPVVDNFPTKACESSLAFPAESMCAKNTKGNGWLVEEPLLETVLFTWLTLVLTTHNPAGDAI